MKIQRFKKTEKAKTFITPKTVIKWIELTPE